MRIGTLFRKLLGVTELIVATVSFEERGLVLKVRPRWRRPRCGVCRKRVAAYDRRPQRYWRHLSLGRVAVWLAYAPRRVSCKRCGVRTEHVPWAAAESRFTLDFEELVAFLAQGTDKTKVRDLMGIAWVTVGEIVERVVTRRLDPGRLDGVRSIGVDEFSYRKHHRYLTVVVDHERQRVIWAAPGRSAETLGSFFKELGLERAFEIKTATVDMAGGYLKALRAWLPQAEVVFDRFHVQQLASDALDEVRRSLVAAIEDPQEAQAVKRSRFALLKNPWNLTRRQKEKVSEVQRSNKPLYRGYLLKETLAKALDYLQPKRAEEALSEWIAWASRSKLKPFVRVARTIRKHFEGITAYVKTRLTNGIVEGFNNKLRMIARRAFGFHSPDPLISMLYLTCGGIALDPPLPQNHPPEL